MRSPVESSSTPLSPVNAVEDTANNVSSKVASETSPTVVASTAVPPAARTQVLSPYNNSNGGGGFQQHNGGGGGGRGGYHHYGGRGGGGGAYNNMSPVAPRSQQQAAGGGVDPPSPLSRQQPGGYQPHHSQHHHQGGGGGGYQFGGRGGGFGSGGLRRDSSYSDLSNGTTGVVGVDLTHQVEIYSATHDALYVVPRSSIISMPSPQAVAQAQQEAEAEAAAGSNGTPTTPLNQHPHHHHHYGGSNKLQLCPHFDAAAADPLASCPNGNNCKYVHARINGTDAIKQDIHVNYAWNSVQEVDSVYERYAVSPSVMLQVSLPNNHTGSEEVPACLVLKTRALGSSRRLISHCAHYYFNRMCNRGPNCMFIHAVSLNPASTVVEHDPSSPLAAVPRRMWGRTQQRRPGASAVAVGIAGATPGSSSATPINEYGPVATRNLPGGAGAAHGYHNHNYQQQQQQQHHGGAAANNGSNMLYPSSVAGAAVHHHHHHHHHAHGHGHSHGHAGMHRNESLGSLLYDSPVNAHHLGGPGAETPIRGTPINMMMPQAGQQPQHQQQVYNGGHSVATPTATSNNNNNNNMNGSVQSSPGAYAAPVLSTMQQYQQQQLSPSAFSSVSATAGGIMLPVAGPFGGHHAHQMQQQHPQFASSGSNPSSMASTPIKRGQLSPDSSMLGGHSVATAGYSAQQQYQQQQYYAQQQQQQQAQQQGYNGVSPQQPHAQQQVTPSKYRRINDPYSSTSTVRYVKPVQTEVA